MSDEKRGRSEEGRAWDAGYDAASNDAECPYDNSDPLSQWWYDGRDQAYQDRDAAFGDGE